MDGNVSSSWSDLSNWLPVGFSSFVDDVTILGWLLGSVYAWLLGLMNLTILLLALEFGGFTLDVRGDALLLGVAITNGNLVVLGGTTNSIRLGSVKTTSCVIIMLLQV